MKPKPFIIAIGCVLILGVFLVAPSAYHFVFGLDGTANDVPSLARVYQYAGPDYAGFYTNSFVHSIPFTQPIHWHCDGARSSDVSLSSRVDVAAFRRKMAAEPFQYLVADNRSGTNPVASFIIYHRVGDWALATHGSLGLITGSFEMRTSVLERSVDDFEWQRMTNGPIIEFDFAGKD
jgi:hypothetical protein